MALVVFLRGMNVGGWRAFRPSTFAKQLADFDTVNVGSAGTFVVRKPGSHAKLLAAFRFYLPVPATIAACEGSDLIRLEAEQPFDTKPLCADQVRFVSILSKDGTGNVSPPVFIPNEGNWFVQIQGRNGRFVFGRYRREMKTITYLGEIDELFGAPATTRSWSTILSVLRILKSEHPR